jgi:hypothetical protein
LSTASFAAKRAGEVLVISDRAARAILLFRGGEAAVEEALAVLVDHAADAGGFHDVDAVTEDRHGRDYRMRGYRGEGVSR